MANSFQNVRSLFLVMFSLMEATQEGKFYLRMFLMQTCFE